MVEAVNEAGGNAHVTLPPLAKHTCFIPAFGENKAMDWMLAQGRGAWVCWTPPGYRPWRLWHILPAPCGLLLAGWLGLWLRRWKPWRREAA